MTDTGIKRPFPDEPMDIDEKRFKTFGANGDAGNSMEGTGEEGGEDFTGDDPDYFMTGETEDGWQTYVAPDGGRPPRRRGFRFPGPWRGPPRGFMPFRGMRGRPPFRGGPMFRMPRFRGVGRPPFFRGGPMPPPPPPPFFRMPFRGPNPKNMTLAEKFDAFGNFLRHIEMDRAPPVTTLWNAINSSRLGLELEYLGDEVEQVAGRPMFTGCLKINGQFIVRAIGSTKKEVKQDVYKKCMDLMIERPGMEIMGFEDPGSEKLKKEMEEQIQAEAARDLGSLNVKEPTSDPITDPETLIALEQFVTNVKALKVSKEKECISPIEAMKLYSENECISQIEKAIGQTTPRPDHEYIVEEIRLANGKNYYVGQLRFGPLVIGRGNGFNKKACKLDTYRKSWHHLTTKPLSDLTVSMPEESKLDIDKIPTQPRKLKAMSKDIPLEERMMDFLNAISTPDEQSFVKTLDVAAFHAALTLTIIYKAKHQNHLKPQMECDLFLEDIWITYHSGSTKKDCMVDVYHKAWKILSQKQAKELLVMKRRLTEADLFGPYMITVYRKGVGNSVDSNATHLKRYGHDLSKVANNRLEDIVILEHNDWSSERNKHAVDILNLSCMQNGLLLQWETETLLNTYSTVNARCQVYIQRQKMGDSYGVGKAQAKELAFKEALYKIYEKQQVIRMNLEGDTKEWILYEQLQKEAEEMQKRGMKPELPVRDEEGNVVSGFVTKAAYEKVKRFAEKKKGEIIFAPGLTADEGKEIRYIGRMLNLKCDMRSHNNQQYIVLFKHIEWSKLVGRLSPTAGLYGKYFRVAKEEIPRYADIQKLILKEPHKNMDDYKEEPMDTKN